MAPLPRRRRRRRPSAPLLVALLALFVALGGPAQAARLIDGSRIEPGTVGSKQLKNRSIKPRDLGSAAVRRLLATPDDSITASKLGENAVTTRALAPGSVLTGTVGDDSLTATDLASNSVRTEEIADNAIGQPEIRSNGVGAAEIAIDAIDGGEIRDGGLSIRDVAREVGTFPLRVPELATNACTTVPVNANGIGVLGDFVVISPTSAWPAGLVYTVNGTGSETQFKVQVCNRGAATPAAATYTFNYAVLGF
jgi:hypothetical protein